MRTPKKLVHVVVAVVVTTASLASLTLTSQAAPPSNDPALAAEYGARYSATLVNAQGFVPNAMNAPNVSATIETALALGGAKVEKATFDRIMTWAQADVETVIVQFGFDQPGSLGELLMLSELAGIDPTNFGGVNLLTRLASTLGDFAPGLYGGADPAFDGAFRQSLALLGIAAVGAVAPPEALQWLTDQQCIGSPASATGGWQPYRADVAVPCDAPDPNTFLGPDTNSTAIAVQALDAFGTTAPEAAALDFLALHESATAGWAFIPGLADDPNSTALVIQAIIAGGENPQTGRWVKGQATPVESLLSWQLGCSAPVAERGAFSSPFSAGAPDAFATRQAVWGAVLQPFPFTSGSFHAAAVPCQPTTTTTRPSTTRPTSTTASTASTTTTVVVGNASASPVVAVPRFAG